MQIPPLVRQFKKPLAYKSLPKRVHVFYSDRPTTHMDCYVYLYIYMVIYLSRVYTQCEWRRFWWWWREFRPGNTIAFIPFGGCRKIFNCTAWASHEGWCTRYDGWKWCGGVLKVSFSVRTNIWRMYGARFGITSNAYFPFFSLVLSRFVQIEPKIVSHFDHYSQRRVTFMLWGKGRDRMFDWVSGGGWGVCWLRCMCDCKRSDMNALRIVHVVMTAWPFGAVIKIYTHALSSTEQSEYVWQIAMLYIQSALCFAFHIRLSASVSRSVSSLSAWLVTLRRPSP